VGIGFVDLGKVSDRPSILLLAFAMKALVALLKVFFPELMDIGVGRGLCRRAFHMRGMIP
jgi:hypothetical protein